MGVIGSVSAVLLLVLVAFAGFVFVYGIPDEQLLNYESEEIFNISGEYQFYSNMRYKDKQISYSLEDSCNLGKIENVEDAVERISSKTVLEFNRINRNGEIEIICSDLSPEPEEKGHFIAGEGGPSEIVKAGRYNVILSGKVSLYRADSCEEGQIATHEILHALGFDHNADKESIMYPVTNCKQEIDQYIIDEINRLYEDPSKPDLLIEKATARKTGRYVDFEVTVFNAGLKDAGSPELVVFADEEEVKTFELKENLGIGTKTKLTVDNLRIPITSNDKISFFIEYSGEELDKENNRVDISFT